MENQEDLNIFVYKYTNHYDDSFVLIRATNILYADQGYLEAFGIDVKKAPYIGCEIQPMVYATPAYLKDLSG